MQGGVHSQHTEEATTLQQHSVNLDKFYVDYANVQYILCIRSYISRSSK